MDNYEQDVIGISPYKEVILDLLSFIDKEKSQLEFDKKYQDVLGSYMKIYSSGLNGYILGTLDQGIGVECWAGKLHLLQILRSMGFVHGEERDGLIYYKKIKDWNH